jgi:hypothetical protein
MRRISAFVFTVLFAFATHADDRQRVLIANVVIQPLFTLASAAVQDKLHTWPDWKRCLGVGAASGLAFYGSKRLVGDGHVIEGLALANVAASMTSNAAAGRHALSRIGVTLGPVRAEFSTRKEPDRSARIHFSANAAELAAFGVMLSRSDEISFRDGLIAFRRDDRYPDLLDKNLKFPAYTIGMFPGTSPEATETAWRHEVVHVIQAMQIDALEPGMCEWGRFDCKKKEPSNERWFEFEPLRLGVFLGAGAGAMSPLDYDQRWTEIEAHRMAEDCEVVNFGCQSVRSPRR